MVRTLVKIDEIVHILYEFDGISRKFVLPKIISRLREDSFRGDQPHSLGEDSAAIGTSSDEVILLTTDSIVEELCLNHPNAAGFNVVLANVMDIYAAGGVPTSFAVALSYSDPTIGEALLEGLIQGSHTFRVPIVRGHTNSSSKSTYIVGSATGTVRKAELLTAGGAESGDSLILIFDKSGKQGEHYKLGWDSVTGRASEEVVKRLSVMEVLAKSHKLHAAKDISVAGMIGTAGMMVEYSGMGGIVNIDAIESFRPNQVTLMDWLRMYISLGFLVATPPESVETVETIVGDHEMVSVIVGSVDDEKSLRLKMGSEERIMFDYSKGPVLTPRSRNQG